MKRLLAVLAITALSSPFSLQAQTPPTLASVTSDRVAEGTAKLSGLAVNIVQGPTLTFFGADFSNDMLARFTTIDLQGVPGTLDIPLSQLSVSGTQDSGKVALDAFTIEHLIIASGPVFLHDNSNGLTSSDSVNIVIIPTIFSLLTSPNDLSFGGFHSISLDEDTLFVEGSGLVQDSTNILFMDSVGDTITVASVAVGSSVPDAATGEGFLFSPDSLGDGLMAKFVLPSAIAESGDMLVETHSGISMPFSYRKPRIDALSRLGPPLRGTPADPGKLSVNVDDTLLFAVTNLTDSNFPSVGASLRLPAASPTQFDSISHDFSTARAIAPARMRSGEPTIINEFSHFLSRFTYFFDSDPGPFVQVVPTLDSLAGPFIAPGFSIQLFGSGFRENPVVKFSKIGGGTIDVNRSSNDGRQISVRIPDDAAPGPVFVETPGGTSDTLAIDFMLKPLEILAKATKGIPADTTEASANSGQTITVKSQGIVSTMSLRLRSGFFPTFPVQNISADSTTAEVTLSSNVFIETGSARLEDSATQTVSESKPLQIVPFLDWVSSPGFVPDNPATLHGYFVLNKTTATFTDSNDTEIEVEILQQAANRREITVRLPARVAAGVVRVSTEGGSDSLVVNPPVLLDLVVSASLGTPADISLPSSNIGDVMLVVGENLSSNTIVRLPTVNQFGTASTVDFELLNVVGGTQGAVVVGSTGITGGLRIATGLVRVGNASPTFAALMSGQSITLQIVPTLSVFDVTSFLPGATATILGTGLIEGQTSVFFADSSGGTLEGLDVDVVSSNNNELNVTLPAGIVADPITVETNGGVSLPLAILPPEITSVSPNEGIRGSGLELTITGANFSAGSLVELSGTGITIDTTAFFSPEILVTVLTIAVDAPLGPRDVIVTNPSNDADTLLTGFNVLADQQSPTISSVTQLPNTGDTAGPYRVAAQVTDNIGVTDVFLVFSTDNFVSSDSIAMTLSGQKYESAIPGQTLNTTVNYFVSAFDAEGNRGTGPVDAPASTFSFAVLAIPVIQPIADQTVDEGQLLTFDISASDPDNDPITLTAADLPHGAAFLDSTFSWMPDYTQSGSYVVTFTADDNDDGATGMEVMILVNEINDPPLVLGPSSVTFFVGQSLDLQLSFADPDDDALTITSSDLPPGATFTEATPGSPIYFLAWSPNVSDAGTYLSRFIADDGLSSDTLDLSIEVTVPSSPILESISPSFAHVGDLVTLKGLAFGDGSGTMVFNGAATPAMVVSDSVASAIIPPEATTGPLFLVSSDGDTSNTRFFSVLPPRTVNLVASFLDASTPLVVVGGVVTLTATTENLGAFATTASMTFFDAHPDSGGVALGSSISFEVDANRQSKVNFEWLTTTAGTFVPHVRISGAEPRETHLTDNVIGNGMVIVAERSQFEAELILIHAPFDEFVIGEPKNYQIKVINVGTETAEITTVTVAGNFGFIPATALPLTVAPGTIASINFTVIIPDGTPPGEYNTTLNLVTARSNEFSHQLLFSAVEEGSEFTLRVLNDDSGLPVSAVRVFANEIELVPTNVSGETIIMMPPGTRTTVLFFKEGFLPEKLELNADDFRRTIDVFIEPGEVLITNVDIDPLDSDDIAEFGLDLNDPGNFNLSSFIASIQTEPDGEPIQLSNIGSDMGLADAFDKEVIEERWEYSFDEDAEYCNAMTSKRLIYTYADGDTLVAFSQRCIFLKVGDRHVGTYYDRIELVESGCATGDILAEADFMRTRRIAIGEMEPFSVECKAKIKSVCRSTGGPAVVGGFSRPARDVTIPYAVILGGSVQTLKEFFDVTLVVGNQADPTFVVSDFDIQLTTDQGLTIVQEAEPLPDIAGGQSASTMWIIRGDMEGDHLLDFKLNAVLQPGNVRISNTQLADVTVNGPPQLDVELQHPAAVQAGESFFISALVQNSSETTTARESNISIFLGGMNSAELLSEAKMQLGDIEPGGSAVAIWSLVALGSGTVAGCRSSSDNNLGFTLLIGGGECDELLPSDTDEDDDAPPGKVVILGTDVPLPQMEVRTLGSTLDGSIRRGFDITDANGDYKFAKRIFGNLEFTISAEDITKGQGLVRPSFVRQTEPVAQDAMAMPILEVGAENKYEELTTIIKSITDIHQTDEFLEKLTVWYFNEELLIESLLKSEELAGFWGPDLSQTRERHYRLFLAQSILASSRRDAIDMSKTTSAGLVTLAIAMAEVQFRLQRLGHIFKNVPGFARLANLSQGIIGWIRQRLISYFNGFQRFAENELLREAFADLVIEVAEIVIKSGYKLIGPAKDAVAIEMLSIYGDLTDDLITKTENNWSSYPGPNSGQSLPRARGLVNSFRGEIVFGASDARRRSEDLSQLVNGLIVINFGLSSAAARAAAVGAAQALAVLETIVQFTQLVQQFAGIGAFAIPAKELFFDIPDNIEKGVEAAFDVSSVQHNITALELPAVNKVENLSFQTESSFGSRRISTNISEAILLYRSQLQEMSDLATSDSIAALLAIANDPFITASDNLTRVLTQTKALLDGGSQISFSQQDARADELLANYSDNLVFFMSEQLVLPWRLIHYSALAEFEGGVTNPDYGRFKQDLLTLIGALDTRAQNLETILLSVMGEYAAKGYIQATAVIDSIWVSVDGQPSDNIVSVPASLIVNARVQNLANEALNDLQLSLKRGDNEGLTFEAGSDSVLIIPQLTPMDNAPHGPDEFIGSWQLSYEGSLTDDRGLSLAAQLNSDSVNVFLGEAQSILVNLSGQDSDGDGMPDEYEISVNFDPGVDNGTEDIDRDNLSNFQEFLLETQPHNPDTDGDGILDGVEVTQQTDPFDPMSPVTMTKAALILPLNARVESGSSIYLPVSVSTGSAIIELQFTIDFDSTLFRFDEVALDSGLFNFTINEINRNPGFPPSTPGTSKNILVKISSPNTSLTGNATPVALFGFTAQASIDSTTTITFDRNPEHTFLKDQDNFDVDIVSFTDATISTPRPVSVKDPEPQLPIQFALEQNYPNPFNPNTTIRYQLPASGDVKLEIFNVLGQRVRTLVDQAQVPGHYAINWDSKNHHGLPVATGMYFYRIVVGDFIKTRKMLLLK